MVPGAEPQSPCNVLKLNIEDYNPIDDTPRNTPASFHTGVSVPDITARSQFNAVAHMGLLPSAGEHVAVNGPPS